MLSALEIISKKRDGLSLSADDIAAFVAGLTRDQTADKTTDQTTGQWSDSQAAALAMAILLQGMTAIETVQLTREMTQSGERLSWLHENLPGPIVDKHSTGGVGDKLSLMLAPMLAACGAVVPMISGRGLAHSGGTLDKLEALPGYNVNPPRETLLATLRGAGCAIVGASAKLAPADKRLYAIRDVTGTVPSVPLITASILSKKLAAGLQFLVLDVKCGNGAFAPDLAQARTLAQSLVSVARDAGLPTAALITDMNQVLGASAGNALEVREAIDFLTLQVSDTPGAAEQHQRQLQITLALGAQALVLAGLCADTASAQERLMASLTSGAAAERFARMVAMLGGPLNVLHDAQLGVAPVQRAVLATRDGFVHHTDTRAIGLAVVALGGGRKNARSQVDPRVGVAQCSPLGSQVRAGQALMQVHAANNDDADAAVQALHAAILLGEEPRADDPLILESHG